MSAAEDTADDPDLSRPPPDPRPDPRRIVAELTRTWVDGGENVHGVDRSRKLISQQFEEMIDVNEKRGYLLESWKFFQLGHGVSTNVMTETIVAVFRRKTG